MNSVRDHGRIALDRGNGCSRIVSRPLLLLITILFPVAVMPQTLQVSIFPSEKIFPSFKADALSHQLSISRVTDNRDWIGVIGGSLPVIEAGDQTIDAQFTIAASAFNRIVKTPGHITVYTIDYKVDFPVDVRFGAWMFRLGYGHISSHYADDGIELLGRSSISAVKDYLCLGVAHDLSIVSGCAYGTVQFNYHNEPILDKKWMLQCGGELCIVSLSDISSVYGAVDIKVKEEVGWATTQSYQIGLKMFESKSRCLRVAYTHRRGMEERGQVFNSRAEVNLFSLCLDF